MCLCGRVLGDINLFTQVHCGDLPSFWGQNTIILSHKSFSFRLDFRVKVRLKVRVKLIVVMVTIKVSPGN